MGDIYLGVIEALGFNFVPRNFGSCAGALIAISQNNALFSLLGTQFGGDGRTSFGLPDFRGRVPMGFGTGPGLTPRSMGQKVGFENVTLVAANLPSHTHSHVYTGGQGISSATVEVATVAGKKQLPDAGDYLAAPANNLGTLGDNLYIAPQDIPNNSTRLLGGVSSSGGGFDDTQFFIGATGNSTPFDIVQPSQVVNFCICMQGIFPSRN